MGQLPIALWCSMHEPFRTAKGSVSHDDITSVGIPNNLLLSWHACQPAGEVPNLLGPDDLEQISAALRPAMAAAGLIINKTTIYDYFVSR